MTAVLTQPALWADPVHVARYVRPLCEVGRHHDCRPYFERSPVWHDACTCPCHH